MFSFQVNERIAISASSSPLSQVGSVAGVGVVAAAEYSTMGANGRVSDRPKISLLPHHGSTVTAAPSPTAESDSD